MSIDDREIRRIAWTTRRPDITNSLADPGCERCRGHGILDDGGDFGAIFIECTCVTRLIEDNYFKYGTDI